MGKINSSLRQAPAPKAFECPIYVTRPILPALDAYQDQLADVWKSGWLTNGGQKHNQLETELSKYLKTPYLNLFNNGTIAMIVACQALRLSGEVITTPFTFPATPHVLSWNGITPVFADIDPNSLTIDPKKIEPLITSKTTGILGVHVYGMPCDVFAIQDIADTYGLKVIYDGAHAFGTHIGSAPIIQFGDATMLSFHATKLFHTVEGGALIVKDDLMKTRVNFLKNFGIKNETEVIMPGINGKMNELQAIMGLLNLSLLEKEQKDREILGNTYRRRLSEIDGIDCFSIPQNIFNSQQYFIIRISEDRFPGLRDILYYMLKEFNIMTRRYFYPLCSEANCYRSLSSANPENLINSHRASREVLALPFYGSLGEENANRICEIIQWIVHGFQ